MTMNNKDTAPDRIWVATPVSFRSLISKSGPAFANDIEYARVDPPAAPTVATEPRQCLKCQHEERFSDNEGGMCERFIGQDRKGFDLKCGCYCEFPSAPPAPDEAGQALARELIGNVNNYVEEHTGELSISAFGPLSQRIAAALAQARKEGAQPIHPDDLADTINKFLFEQYACTIDHPRMHILKELVQWWPDPASKQER